MKTVVGLLSLLATLLLLPLGHATVFPGSGNFIQTSATGVTTSQADVVLTIRETFGLTWTGAFTGTSIGTVTIIVDLSRALEYPTDKPLSRAP